MLYKHEKRQHKPKNINEVHQETMTAGERVADNVASSMGSWGFILIQASIMLVWVTLNIVAWVYHWDPYPYILLNLAMSAQAAFATPLIMMSQNRQAAKDRLMAEHDFEINQSSFHDIEQLATHLEKQDEELLKQTAMLLKQNEMLLDLLTRNEAKTSKRPAKAASKVQEHDAN